MGFDIPRDLTQAVKYESRVRIIGNLEELSGKAKEDIIQRLNWTKYKGWSYEREHRSWAGRTEKDPDTGLYFVQFSETLMLREVLLGERCTVTRQEIRSALRENTDVKISKLCHHPTKFKMEVE